MTTRHARTRVKDRTVDLLRDGYTFMDTLRVRAARPAARALPVKLLGRPGLLIRGTEAVRSFYDTSRFRRTGAMPLAVKLPLFGKDSVHGLDGDAHRHRKQLFLQATTDERVEALVRAVDREWERTLPESGALDVHGTAVRVYGRAVMRWAGLELPDAELDERAAKQAAIVDGFGTPALPWARAMLARRDNDAWAKNLVARTRANPAARERPAEEMTALELVAAHRDEDGRLLDEHAAAVALQNILRPTIAVSWFAAFVAVALSEHPEWAARLRAETAARGNAVGGPEATAFAHEVRRVYPFVPLLPARARRDMTLEGERVAEGQRVFLDVYGTNNDPAEWDRPGEFDPSRFLGVEALEVENFVPQGGGTPSEGHRCPGEGMTVGLLATTAARLAARNWTVDDEDLFYDLHRMPTRPQGGPVICLER